MMTTQHDFTGKVAFVTGAGTGIGRATALAFAAAGASVAAVGRSQSDLQETVRLIEQSGGRAIHIQCDVAEAGDVEAAIATTDTAFGRLDFAFNNAGIEQPRAPTAELSIGTFDRVLAINLRGVFVCMKYQVPLMIRTGGGSIVNTSSGAGVKGFAGLAAYCASKFGLIGLTKAAALDYANANVRVNAVCPGIIETPLMDRVIGGSDERRQAVIAQEPIGRMGRPEEIAGAVLWLCSDAAAFTVGAAMVVDGGQTA